MMMNIETGISLAALILGASGAVASWYCYGKYKVCRGLLEFTEKQIQDLDTDLTKSRETIETSQQRLGEQSRRVAWLETRVRSSRPTAKDVQDDSVLLAPVVAPKSNMTERRHRILSLASRGQNAETIAATLGMMPGEVELIINLNRATLSLN